MKHANDYTSVATNLKLCRQLIHCGDLVVDFDASTADYALLFSQLVVPNGRIHAVATNENDHVELQQQLSEKMKAEVVSLHPPNCDKKTFYNLKVTPIDFIKMDTRHSNTVTSDELGLIMDQFPAVKILCEFAPHALWSRGDSPIQFLENMRQRQMRLVVHNKKTWIEGNIGDIIDELRRITPTHPDLCTADFLEQSHYKRPVFESLLFVPMESWKTVCTALGIDSPNTNSVDDTNPDLKWKCRWATPMDRDPLLALFLSVFKHVLPSALWDWKYINQQNQGVLAHSDGKMIAYYGGMPRMLWLHGKRFPATQICDVMVASNVRGIMTRNGAFASAAKSFIKSQIGRHATYQLAFGFPSERHARLGELLNLYTRVDTLFDAAWTDLNASLPFWINVKKAHSRSDALFNKLWLKMKKSFGSTVMPEKDAHFFKWRYIQHPIHKYEVYVVSLRWVNIPIGVFVLHDHGPDQGMELMDLLGNSKTLNTLFAASLMVAKHKNHRRLFSWMSPTLLSVLPKPNEQKEITHVCIDTGENDIRAHLEKRSWFLSGDLDCR